jgi:hypothetical protein
LWDLEQLARLSSTPRSSFIFFLLRIKGARQFIFFLNGLQHQTYIFTSLSSRMIIRIHSFEKKNKGILNRLQHHRSNTTHLNKNN